MLLNVSRLLLVQLRRDMRTSLSDISRQCVRYIRGRAKAVNWRFEILFLGVILLVISLCLSLWFRAPGLPQSHEYFSHAVRTALYAEHFRNGDVFPIWFSSDGLGLGSPLALFYHKTFYYVAGVLYAVSGAVKFALVIALAVFMLIGAYGMRAATRLFTGNAVLMIASASALLLSQYAFTDWLIRAAMAEFSAMMLIPWLLWWCLLLARHGRFSMAIVPILLLLFHAHNVTALFSVPLIAVAVGVYIFRTGRSGVHAVWRRATVCAALFAILLVPQFMLQAVFLEDYDPSKITQAGYQASLNIRPLHEYLHDADYVWLTSWENVTVQIDRPVLLSLAAILGVALYCRLNGRKNAFINMRRIRPDIAVLGLSLAVFIFFQTALSRPIYESIGFLQFLQFPWRLLAYITPLGILLAVAFASLVRNERLLLGLGIGWIVAFAAWSPIPQQFRYRFFTPSEVQAYISGVRPDLTGGMLAGIGEYYPIVTDPDGRVLTSQETVALYQGLYKNGNLLQVKTGDCYLEPLDMQVLEPAERNFTYTCTTAATVALPVSYNRMSIVWSVDTEKHTTEKLPYTRQDDDPRIIVRLEPGKGRLRVELPNVVTLTRKVLQ